MIDAKESKHKAERPARHVEAAASATAAAVSVRQMRTENGAVFVALL